MLESGSQIRLTNAEMLELERRTGVKPDVVRSRRDLQLYMLIVVEHLLNKKPIYPKSVTELLVTVSREINDVCGTVALLVLSRP